MKKILIIEDELIIALDLKHILKDQGYDVLFNIVSYAQMVSVIDVFKPDLVLIDIKIVGDKDGIDIAQFIQAKYQTPFIFITSCHDVKTLQRIKDSVNPAAFIIKPFRRIDIITTVEIVLNNAVKKNSSTHNDLPLQLKKVVDYIDENIYNKIEVADIIVLTTWKAPYFSKIFKDYMKITPYQYIIKRKIDIAKIHLLEEDFYIKDLASVLCFESYSNFFNAFVKYAKTTPEKFRVNNN